MSRVIPLGGKYFVPTEHTTARQDGWMVVQMADAGLDQFAGRTLDEATSRDLVLAALRSGKTWHLLAGLLVESGKAWTPQIAEENAAFFAELSDLESKRAMDEAFLGLLAGFFFNAPTSSALSPSASTATGTTSPTPPSDGAPSIDLAGPAPAATGGSAQGS